MRTYVVLIIGLLFLFPFFGCQDKQEQPNILFIAVDDLRPEIGAYGNDIAFTPNMDKLANEGTVFNNHFVQVPTCGASRYSLLTGMRPSKPIHLSNRAIEAELSDKSETKVPETFIHHLKRNGYYTVGIGKISHSADGFLYGYTEEISDKRELPHSWNELVFNSGKWKTGWNAFFGYANGENRQSLDKNVKPYEAGNVKDDGYVDGLTAELSISKLRQLKMKDEPFFLAVGFFKPHLPFNAPKKYWDLYDRDEIPLSPNPEIPENVHLKSLHESGEFNQYKLTDETAHLSEPITDEYAKKLRHSYLAAVSYVDAQIGKVLDELQTLGLEKNTIVVLWGDHGWHLGDQRIWGKHTLFENALKSALIVKDPKGKLKKGSVNSIVETVDIYPSLLEFSNIDPAHSIDGESFIGLQEDSEGVGYSYFKNGISLRTSRYRLTKYFRKEEPSIELYDHINDPYETRNIGKTNRDLVEELMPILVKGNTGLYSDFNNQKSE
ncbi:sulfatase [Maribacter sp. HTCC2170]|uniref:sulfatase n=1 Tax=Maribacter sp. (strain HTCC2170 / KCCM 42371) TaxID=313603 RepID=UPI00006BD353|nr:sulfatase [Maribacter sp. HTCC2170]EAR02980.1 iduronate-2-sulfatase [Maribacter sp. HTCC2170]